MSARTDLAEFLGVSSNKSHSYNGRETYSQDYIPVKDIYRGVIITPDDRYIKVVEILPTNFTLRTETEKDNIIYNYMSWLYIAPVKTLLKVITKRADTSELVEDVHQRIQNESNERVQEMGLNYANFIHITGSSTAVSRRFFLIFEYEVPKTFFHKVDSDFICNELDKITADIESYFSNCGNVLLKPENPDAFVGDFLYMYYNRNSYASESFIDRVTRIDEDTNTIFKDSEEDMFDLKNAIAPRGINFENKGYYIMDGMYHTHMFIDPDSLPVQVYGGWMSNIVSAYDGVDVDIFTTKIDRDTMINKTAQKIKFKSIALANRENYQKDFESIQGVVSGANYIKERMAQGDEPFYFNIFFSIHARTFEELSEKKQQLVTDMKANGLSVNTCDNVQKEALMSLSPFLTLSPKLNKRSRRNLLTSSLACCYPYTAFELYDKGGIFLGLNGINSSLVILNRYDTDKYANANVMIVGTSGAGKSYTLQLLALRERILGSQVFIISPEKQHEFRRSASAIGGAFIEISTSSKDRINVFDIYPSVSPVAEYIDGVSTDDTTWLAKKVETLITWFSLQITNPSMTDEEEELLASCIYQMYLKKGITDDNDSLYLDPDNKEAGLKEMPIMSDLYQEEKLPRRIKEIMGKFINGRAKIFNGQTNVDLNNPFTVFGLEGLEGSKLLSSAMFMCLDIIWGKAKSDRTARKSIYIDEGWKLVNGSNIKTAEFVQNIFKTIRGYGGSAIFATQEINDLFALENGKYGNAIMSCSEVSIVLKMKKKEVERVDKLLTLSEKEVQDIQHFYHQALICTNENHIPVRIKGSPMEHELITTNAAELKEIYESMSESNEEVL